MIVSRLDTLVVHFSSLQRSIADVLRDVPDVRSVEVVQTTTKRSTPDRAQEAA